MTPATTFLGIQSVAANRPLHYVALDQELNLKEQATGDPDKVSDFAAGQAEVWVAINLPARRPRPSNVQPGLFSGQAKPGRSIWDQAVNLIDVLKTQGFQTNLAEDNGRVVLATRADGCYSALLGRKPFPRMTLEGRLQRQLLLYKLGLDVPDPMEVFEEITRHHLLQGELPLNGLYTAPQLDALSAAYTIFLAAARPGDVRVVDDETVGRIVLPVTTLT